MKLATLFRLDTLAGSACLNTQHAHACEEAAYLLREVYTAVTSVPVNVDRLNHALRMIGAVDVTLEVKQ
jgi:hypothetical protein